jgi:hypothetical protein
MLINGKTVPVKEVIDMRDKISDFIRDHKLISVGSLGIGECITLHLRFEEERAESDKKLLEEYISENGWNDLVTVSIKSNLPDGIAEK